MKGFFKALQVDHWLWIQLNILFLKRRLKSNSPQNKRELKMAAAQACQSSTWEDTHWLAMLMHRRLKAVIAHKGYAKKQLLHSMLCQTVLIDALKWGCLCTKRFLNGSSHTDERNLTVCTSTSSSQHPYKIKVQEFRIKMARGVPLSGELWCSLYVMIMSQ